MAVVSAFRKQPDHPPNKIAAMPNTKTAKKRLRQNIAQRLRNRSVKRAVRTQCRKVREAIKAGDLEQAQAEFRAAAKRLDRAGARKIIHQNAAARAKSRLSAKIKVLKATS
jgi:small subunit ribosomal protein S20